MVAYPSRWRSSDPVAFSRVSGGEPSMAQMGIWAEDAIDRL